MPSGALSNNTANDAALQAATFTFKNVNNQKSKSKPNLNLNSVSNVKSNQTNPANNANYNSNRLNQLTKKSSQNIIGSTPLIHPNQSDSTTRQPSTVYSKPLLLRCPSSTTMVSNPSNSSHSSLALKQVNNNIIQQNTYNRNQAGNAMNSNNNMNNNSFKNSSAYNNVNNSANNNNNNFANNTNTNNSANNNNNNANNAANNKKNTWDRINTSSSSIALAAASSIAKSKPYSMISNQPTPKLIQTNMPNPSIGNIQSLRNNDGTISSKKSFLPFPKHLTQKTISPTLQSRIPAKDYFLGYTIQKERDRDFERDRGREREREKEKEREMDINKSVPMLSSNSIPQLSFQSLNDLDNEEVIDSTSITSDFSSRSASPQPSLLRRKPPPLSPVLKSSDDLEFINSLGKISPNSKLNRKQPPSSSVTSSPEFPSSSPKIPLPSPLNKSDFSTSGSLSNSSFVDPRNTDEIPQYTDIPEEEHHSPHSNLFHIPQYLYNNLSNISATSNSLPPLPLPASSIPQQYEYQYPSQSSLQTPQYHHHSHIHIPKSKKLSKFFFQKPGSVSTSNPTEYEQPNFSYYSTSQLPTSNANLTGSSYSIPDISPETPSPLELGNSYSISAQMPISEFQAQPQFSQKSQVQSYGLGIQSKSIPIPNPNTQNVGKQLVFKTTLRQESKKHRQKTEFNEDKPWKHHYGTNYISDDERKRYEGVWVANKGLYIDDTNEKDGELIVDSENNNNEEGEKYEADKINENNEVNENNENHANIAENENNGNIGNNGINENNENGEHDEINKNNEVGDNIDNEEEEFWEKSKFINSYSHCSSRIHGLIVREIWSRSMLDLETLSKIWQLVLDDRRVKYLNYLKDIEIDHKAIDEVAQSLNVELGRDEFDDGSLTREEFVVGMWLIDQCLYGRKLPKIVSKEVWLSVDTGLVEISKKRKYIGRNVLKKVVGK